MSFFKKLSNTSTWFLKGSSSRRANSKAASEAPAAPAGVHSDAVVPDTSSASDPATAPSGSEQRRSSKGTSGLGAAQRRPQNSDRRSASRSRAQGVRTLGPSFGEEATAAAWHNAQLEEEMQLALALSLSTCDQQAGGATSSSAAGGTGPSQRREVAPVRDGLQAAAAWPTSSLSTRGTSRPPPANAMSFEDDIDPTFAARDHALERLSEILANCEATGSTFVDPGFRPGPQVLYANGQCRRRQANDMEVVRHFGAGGRDGIMWCTAGEIIQRPDDLQMEFESTQEMLATARQYARCVEWRVFQNDPSPTDISQGGLGNCWFCGSLAAVAEKPQLIHRLFVDPFSNKGDLSPRGVYLVRLCDGGEWRYEVMDGLFPCSRHRMLAFSGARRNQLWVPLIEKAYAKLRGNYEAVEGGTPAEGLRLFTGWPSIVQELQAAATSRGRSDDQAQAFRMQAVCPYVDEDLLWTRLVSAFDSQLIICGSCGHVDGITDQQYRSAGLSPSHCYSIVRMATAGQGTIRILKLRNPWGTGRKWNGRFSDEDLESWTPELKAEVGEDDLGAEGVFWMMLQDVRRFFNSITICPYREGWAEARRMGSFPASAVSGHQPAFLLTSDLPVEVLLSLMQPEERTSPTMMTADVGIMLFKLKRNGGAFTGRDEIVRSLQDWCPDDATQRRVQDTLVCDYMIHGSGKASLGAAPEPILVVPLSFNQRSPPGGCGGNDKRFTFACFSAHPVVVRSLALSAEAHRDALVAHVRKTGKRSQLFQDAHLWKSTDAGLVVFVENGSEETLLVESKLTELFNMTVSRGMEATATGEQYLMARDTVPPMHGMVVFVAAAMPAGHKYHFVPKVHLHRSGVANIHEPPLAEPYDALHSPFYLEGMQPSRARADLRHRMAA
eukprot:TRINITY_DN38414_c0_g1_i1.p1 TRINITY_DN38414_c0_g1~~TRINITY_DN38414_c0_g1_i1.p1  ORF type:complete len:894 (-),score=162.22 TRINITY_DN38414_c0_g1_i1:266-2947(-)